jgi:hypothetical protein
MTFGAVVEKVDSGVPSLHDLGPSLDGFFPSEAVERDYSEAPRFASRHPSHAKSPPSAARRHALLQSFLF